jgi:hypothetical protein
MRFIHGERDEAAVPMILDRGDAASVAVICCPCVPFVGMRFVHSGTVWEVTHAKDHARGWVAQPVPRVPASDTALRVVRSTRCVREA